MNEESKKDALTTADISGTPAEKDLESHSETSEESRETQKSTPEINPEETRETEANLEASEQPQASETNTETPEESRDTSQQKSQTPEMSQETEANSEESRDASRAKQSMETESDPEMIKKDSQEPEANAETPRESRAAESATTSANPAKSKRRGRREMPPPEKKSKPESSTGGKPVMVYILLLFSAALFLMGLSSLMHQRSNQEVLGQLKNDLSDMREAQDFQKRIIELQQARQESEDQLKEAQRNLTAIVSQTQEDRNRSEALQYLYLIMMEFQMEHYQSCQALIQELESRGLEISLPGETIGSAGLAAGVASPVDRYYQIKEAISARIAEGLPPQTVGVMNEEWIPETEEIPETISGEESYGEAGQDETEEASWEISDGETG